MKKLSLILTLATILAITTSCERFDGTAVYNHRGETYAELCDNVDKVGATEYLSKFSLIILNFDNDPCVTESEYEISGARRLNRSGDTTGYIHASVAVDIHLSDSTISESEVKIVFMNFDNKRVAETCNISQNSTMELIRSNENSFYEYSLVVDGEDCGTVKFSCAEELSEEALDELCDRVLNNVVIVNNK